MKNRLDDIASRVLAWFDQHGRKDLPWQQDKNRYRVWVSEIMLQQTQVSSVIDYFQRFMLRFPDVATLAAADIDDVLSHWSGLGYYARARNLHKSANIIVKEHAGDLPATQSGLEALPGIGRSTAAAILALVDGQRCAILDGNVKRVLARHEAVDGWPGKTTVAASLWEAAERYTPDTRVSDYTQAMMDLGATLCRRTKPACERCPLRASCRALAADAIARFPGKRAKKPNPKRVTQFMVLRRADGALWLQKRPDAGIWGGLYCFPEYADSPTLPAGFTALGTIELMPFTHKFTHFDLTITPVLIDGDVVGQIADVTAGRWLQIDQFNTIGVPRPVERVIESLQSTPTPQGKLL